MINKTDLTIMALTKKYKVDIKKYVDLVNDMETWSDDKTYEYQCKKLSEMILHAYSNVPFYKKHFDVNGINPHDIRILEDLNRIPIIDKNTVRANFKDFLATDFDKYKPIVRFTGGTTGKPFKFYKDLDSWALGWACKIKAFHWGGYKFGKDKLAVFAGGSLLPTNKLSLKAQLWRYLLNNYSVPITRMDEKSALYHLRNIKKKKIRFLRGYPSAIYSFASMLKQKNLTHECEAIFTTAEVLYDHHRELFKEVFSCDTFDWYGCGEGAGMACETIEHDGFKVLSERGILQVVDGLGRNVVNGVGDIILTSINDFAMPFIRYKPGDKAVIQQPNNYAMACGNTKISKIIGRESDQILLPNGTYLNGLSLPFEVWADKIKQFQIKQVQDDLLIVLLVVENNFNEHDRDKVYELMTYHCGKSVRINIELVDNIELPKSGKFRYIVSELT